MSYKNLEIWKLAKENLIQIHKMTLTELLNLKCMRKEVKFADQANQLDPTLLKDIEEEDTEMIILDS
jgi:hypothetical protein